MKTILIPTDFSSCSDKAVEFGIEIAKRTSAHILLVNSFFVPVLDINVPPTMLEGMYEAEEKNAEVKLKEICKRIQSETGANKKNLSSSYVVEQNLPESEIEKIAKREHADLVIMGTKGKEGVLGLWRSITLSASQRLHCPVLVVKEDTTFSHFHKIDFALENVKEELKSIKKVVDFAKVFHAEVTLVHVEKHAKSSDDIQRIYENTEDAESFMPSIKEFCDYEYINYATVLSGDTAEGLLKYLKGTQADVLSLLRYDRNWIEELFHKSVIKSMIAECTSALLIIPKENQ